MKLKLKMEIKMKIKMKMKMKGRKEEALTLFKFKLICVKKMWENNCGRIIIIGNQIRPKQLRFLGLKKVK